MNSFIAVLNPFNSDNFRFELLIVAFLSIIFVEFEKTFFKGSVREK